MTPLLTILILATGPAVLQQSAPAMANRQPQGLLPTKIPVTVNCGVSLGRFRAIHGVNGGTVLGDFHTTYDQNSWDTYYDPQVQGQLPRAIGRIARADYTLGGESHIAANFVPELRAHDIGIGDMQRLWVPTKGTRQLCSATPGLCFTDTVEPRYLGEDTSLPGNYSLGDLLGWLEDTRVHGFNNGLDRTKAYLRFGTGNYKFADGTSAPGRGIQPDDFDGFAEVCVGILARLDALGYGDLLEYVEVWNEPYLPIWWQRTGSLPANPPPIPGGYNAGNIAGMRYADLYAKVLSKVTAAQAQGIIPAQVKVLAHFPAPFGEPSVPTGEWIAGFHARIQQAQTPLDYIVPHFYVDFAQHMRARIDQLNSTLGPVKLVVSEWNRRGNYAHGMAAAPFVLNMLYELNGGPHASAVQDPGTAHVVAAQMYAARTAFWTLENDIDDIFIGPTVTPSTLALNVNKTVGLVWDVYGTELLGVTPNRVQALGSYLMSGSNGTDEFTVMAGLSDAGDQLDVVTSLYHVGVGQALPQYHRSGEKRDVELLVANLPFSGQVRVRRFRETANPDFTTTGATLEPVPGGNYLIQVQNGAFGLLFEDMAVGSYEVVRITLAQ